LPFVPGGAGAASGLSPLEHVQWAKGLQPPEKFRKADLDQDLQSVLEWVTATSVEDIDRYRAGILTEILQVTAVLEPERDLWAQDAPEVLKPLVTRIHGPLVLWLADRIGYDAVKLVEDLQQGFMITGALPPCEEAARAEIPPWTGFTEDQLRDSMEVISQCTVANVRDSEHMGDVWEDLRVDFELGSISKPQVLEPGDLSTKLLTRRLTVREERAKGWRTRICDHCTESGLNVCVQPQDRPLNDNLDVMAGILCMLADLGVHPQFWKRDVSRAFRRIPVRFLQHDLCWVLWIANGVLYIAQHRATGFGPTGAVYAWHRVGSFKRAVLRRLVRVMACRYVDDFYGVDKKGVKVTGGVATSVLLSLIGLPADEDKSDDHAASMAVLGIVLTYCPRTLSTTGEVQPTKAVKWASQLQDVCDSKVCSAGAASKMAGRLAHTVCQAADRVGRAFIWPWYAQQHDPLRGGAASLALQRSAAWFRSYLLLRPPTIRAGPTQHRRHLVTWTDAAGATRDIAAVLWDGASYFFTVFHIPPVLWNQLLPRKDNQIQFAELAGVLLAWGTFRMQLHGNYWSTFQDNQAVERALLKASGGTPECNAAVGKFWQEMAVAAAAFTVWRVESHANIADGPSRQKFDELRQLGALQVPSVLPAWALDLWAKQAGPVA